MHFYKLIHKEKCKKREIATNGRHARAKMKEFQPQLRDFLESYHKKRWFKPGKCTHTFLVGQLSLVRIMMELLDDK